MTKDAGLHRRPSRSQPAGKEGETAGYFDGSPSKSWPNAARRRALWPDETRRTNEHDPQSKPYAVVRCDNALGTFAISSGFKPDDTVRKPMFSNMSLDLRMHTELCAPWRHPSQHIPEFITLLDGQMPEIKAK
jgi:hypothetical protein